MSDNLEEKKKKALDDDQLDAAAGGGWGYHTYHDENQYNAVGIRTDWTSFINPFCYDDFYWTPPGTDENGKAKKEEKITKYAAANIVFYHHATGHLPKDVATANRYKADHVDLYKKDVAASNA